MASTSRPWISSGGAISTGASASMAGQCACKAPALSLVEPVTAMTVAEALTKLHACWGEIHLDVSRSGVATVANLSSAERAWSGSHNSLHEREAATSNLDAPRMN